MYFQIREVDPCVFFFFFPDQQWQGLLAKEGCSHLEVTADEELASHCDGFGLEGIWVFVVFE